MENQVNNGQTVVPQTEDTLKETKNEATTLPNKDESTLEVKYNKEIHKLDLATATVLAQKGMKYDAIKEDYDFLKKLADKENLSVPSLLRSIADKNLENRKKELVEKCGGNQDMAEHILSLEDSKQNQGLGFDELTIMFPEIKTEDDLPPSVLERAKERGTLLLDEFLRYRLENERKIKSASDNQKKAEKSSLGSQQNINNSLNPETEEFLKGLWK